MRQLLGWYFDDLVVAPDVIGSPSRECSSMTFTTAALSAISARTSRGSLRSSADGLTPLDISSNQGAMRPCLNYTKLAMLLKGNNRRRSG